MEVEDEVPEGELPRTSRMTKIPPWLIAVWIGGYLVCTPLFFAMASATRAAVATRSAYDSAPACTFSGSSPCGPDDATFETIIVTGSVTVTDDKNVPLRIELSFTDPSGQDTGGVAEFDGNDMPPIDPVAGGAGQKFSAELWHGRLMWVAADADAARYYPAESVEHTTAYTPVAPAVIGLICFVFCCFAWWLLVKRGKVSDRGSPRPLVALASLVVTCTGWELIARTEASGVTVMGIGLLIGVLLGVPPLPPRWSPATWPDHVRIARARKAVARERERGGARIFR